MKRILALITCMLLLASSLTACEGGKTQSEVSSNEISGEGINYSGKVTFSIDSGSQFEDSFRKPFNELYPDIEIELIESSPLERLEKLMIMIASKTAPDVVMMEQAYYTQLAPSGHMYSLDDLVEADPDIDYSMFDDNGIEYYKSFDGKAYSIPISPYHKLLFFNKKTFDKYGVEYPYYGMTMEDLLEKARLLNEKIIAAGDDKTDMRPFCQWEILIEPLTAAMGENFYNAETVESNINNPKVMKAIHFWSDLWNENLMITQQEAKAKGYGDTYKLFVQKQYPMIIEHSWIIGMPTDPEISDLEYKGVYDAIPIPNFEGEENVQPPITYLGIGMTKDVKDPELAFQVVKFAAKYWYDNIAKEDNIYNPNCYKESDSNKILMSNDYFPGFKYILETKSASNPAFITEIHDEIVWTAIRDVTSEAAIKKTSFDTVLQQIDKATISVLERYKKSK
jgi:ABC-type glycerol-3-phosphate transport system substrate-binding protein